MKEENNLALTPSPIDRLASLFVDIFIIFPVVLLLSSGLRAKMNELATLGYREDLDIGQGLLFFISYLVICFYRTAVMVSLGQTLGQRIMGIKYDVERFSTVWHRTVSVFLWNHLGLLFPFCVLNFSIFYDLKNRGVFDRLFGVKLVATRSPLSSISPLAKTQFKLIFDSFLFTNFLVWILFLGFLSIRFQQQSVEASFLSRESKYVCEDIKPYHDAWREDDLVESRLETAITLYLIGRISEDCLNRESAFSLQANNENELGYFGAFLAHDEDEQGFLQGLYAKEVCKKDSNNKICQYVQESNNEISYEAIKNQVPNENVLLFDQVWKVKRELYNGFFLSAVSSLEQIPDVFGFDLFKSQLLVKASALLGNQDLSNSAIGFALAGMTNDSQLEFSRWVCDAEVRRNDCSALTTKACGRFQSRAGVRDELAYQDDYLMTKLEFCKGGVNSVTTKNRVLSGIVGKMFGTEKELESVIFNQEAPDHVRLDAIYQFVKRTSSKSDVLELAQEWRSRKERDYRWRMLGEILYQKLASLNETNIAGIIYTSLYDHFGAGEFKPLNERIRFPASEKSDGKIIK